MDWCVFCAALCALPGLALSARTAAQSLASPLALAAQMRQEIRQGNLQESTQTVRKILSQQGLGRDFLKRLGIYLARQGLYGDAQRVFSRTVQLYPGSFEARYDLVLADLARQQSVKAQSDLAATPAGSGDQKVALQYLRGKVESQLGQTAAARRDLEAAFHAQPEAENYALDLGLVELKQFDYRGAVSTFAASLNDNPKSTYLALGLALAQFLAGETSESQKTSERLVAENPHWTPARLLLGYSLYIGGRYAAAQTIMDQRSGTHNAHPYLDYLDAVIGLKLHSQDYPRILSELESAEYGIPKCALCYVAASKARQQIGQPQGALRDLRTALQLDPTLPEAWYRLAVVEESLGHPTEAARARSRFSELKTAKANHEEDMLRSAFMNSLAQ